MNEYLNNSLDNPKYLFHGSPWELDIIEKRMSHDSNNNKDNIDNAVFLTSSFIIASAYAFKDKIKELSKDLDWDFEIGYDDANNKINISFKNVVIDDNIEGYIYVFSFNKKYEQSSRIQYKCHENIKPIDVIKIRFKDYKEYYDIN